MMLFVRVVDMRVRMEDGVLDVVLEERVEVLRVQNRRLARNAFGDRDVGTGGDGRDGRRFVESALHFRGLLDYLHSGRVDGNIH